MSLYHLLKVTEMQNGCLGQIGPFVEQYVLLIMTVKGQEIVKDRMCA